ncbi:MAG TPA: hypothetical protein VEU08_17155 [Vicinamibacterales bacterium]|nr:hypothetical protein [Vicinamibacterales bacterium]
MIREESETMPAYRVHLDQRLEESQVPVTLREGLREYITIRRPVGHFLTAVLSNDLAGACARGDEFVLPHLSRIVFFLWNYAPGNCWGTSDRVALWLADPNPPPEVFE